MNVRASIHKAISLLEDLWAVAASICLFMIMLIVFVDVGLRYLFNAPLGWSYDLISLYLMVALFFLALSVTQRDNHHVRVDIAFRHVSPRARYAMELVGYLLTVVLLSCIVYQGGAKFWSSWQNHDVVAGAVLWPTWVSVIFVPLGVGLLVLRLVFSIVSLAMAIATGSATAVGISDSSASESES